MISALIWLFLFLNNYISNENVFWTVYLPAQIIEVIVFLFLLPKIADWGDCLLEGK